MAGCSSGLLFSCCVAAAVASSIMSRENTSWDIRMRKANPKQPDAYLCTSYNVEEEEAYIVKFEAMANASTAHHILMYGCELGPAMDQSIWQCPPICRGGGQQIMFAWAKNAPPTQLPDGVGLRIGKKTSIRTIVLQVHYAKAFAPHEKPDESGIRLHLKKERQPYVAGIFLLMSYMFSVPPNNPKYHVDMSCQYKKQYSMFPFAYRTHAHGLGSVISGYHYNNSFHLIGKGNPQWPQAFYPSNTSIEVKPGDKLAARCTYNSTGRNRYTSVGATGNDEMCNFYIMFYTDAREEAPSSSCGGNKFPQLIRQLPEGNDVPLPPNPELDEIAHGHHHHHHGGMPNTHTEVSSTSAWQPSSTAEPLSGQLEYQSEWPLGKVEIGQVGGVATDKDGNVYIFHRGSRVWDQSSFNVYNDFQFPNQPIMNDTVLVFSRDGHLVRKFGSGRFFMPHGIEVDSEFNIWLTDVALHQVFRFPANSTEPDLVLGERFVHKLDTSHFCKPSDVAVLASGEFYVTDGYCHSRVLKFSKEGDLIKEWGKENLYRTRGTPPPMTFSVPHSISVAEDLDRVFVADRENGRIQTFDLDGVFQDQIQHPEFGPRLFAVEYCPRHGGLLFAVNGPSFGRQEAQVQGFTMDATTGHLLEQWTIPQGLHNPHDVAVDVGGHAVYVGELNPAAVWKFARHTAGDDHSANVDAKPDLQQPSTHKPAVATQVPDKKNNIPSGNSDSTETKSQESAKPSEEASGKAEIAKSLKEGLTPEDEDMSDFTPSIIIGVLLVIPVVLLLVITLIMRVHYKGWTCFSGGRGTRMFNLQSFLGNSHKGFDKLSQDDSDHDNDVLSDSDNEEFRQPRKSKA